MKKLNNFLDKAPLWQIYIFGWASTALVTFIIFVGFSIPEAQISIAKSAGIGATMGLIFGLMFMLMFSMSRNSNKFWDFAKEVETLIEAAETKEALQSIFDNEFQTLQKLQQGHPHGSKLKELYAILKTKYKYAK
jgi:hypothetical protein